MKLSDLIIDPHTVGQHLLLVDVSPYYKYVNNQKTDEIEGYKYSVAMAEKGLEKINVKIAGQKLMETPESFVEVKFTGLELSVYMMNNKPEIGAKATGISLATNK